PPSTCWASPRRSGCRRRRDVTPFALVLTFGRLVQEVGMRVSGLAWVFSVAAALAAFQAAAQPQTPSEDNMGVRTEDGYRTTDPRYNHPQGNIGGSGGSGGGFGHPGSGSQAAVALSNQLLNGALADQPLVPAAQNPLIGRWRTTGGNLGGDLGSIGAFGQMSAGMLNDGCQAIFGKEVTFGPSSFERVGADGRKQVLQHVEYHGNATTM